jgi:uncharacterized protein YndB with AHSA1/START domain
VTETVTTTVEQTIRIAARPETVWAYWTDPELLREWWGAAVAFDTQPGGDYLIEMPQGPVMGGEFVELVPHERIVFTFGWVPSEGLPEIALGETRVEVTLVEDDGDTVLTLRHSGIPAVYAADHGVGWSQHLAALAKILSR